MYRLDWVEQFKLKEIQAPQPGQIRGVAPGVWNLGITSCLTDISSEMVNSVLPIYLVLYLHLSPAQYGAVDGIYNGFALAALSLVSGMTADRWKRHKEIAIFGYGLSAVCKTGLLLAGTLWSALVAIIAMDRIGKGIRTAPRDALISLYSGRDQFSTAFAVHRMLDSAGMLLGPAIAFGLLWYLPNQYDVVWVCSAVIAFLGVSVLCLFVPKPEAMPASVAGGSYRSPGVVLSSLRFRALCACGILLALATISDGFVFLQLQRKTNMSTAHFPLYYVLTSCAYMLFSIPIGRLADTCGRSRVFLSGFAVLIPAYIAISIVNSLSTPGVLVVIAVLGVHYAATEGILMALGSAVTPPDLRTSGLALLATVVGLGKLGSALIFGWMWQAWGPEKAALLFAVALTIAIAFAGLLLFKAPDA